MHVQSTFIITVTAVVTNTKHTRTRSVSLSISFLGAPAPGDEAPTARASLPRAPPRLRARAPERANTATRSQTSRATRRSMSSSHRATRRRIVIAIENSINERTNAIRVVASPHRARATRKRREGERRRFRRVSSAPHDERTSGRAVEATTSDAARGGGESGQQGEWVAW